MARRGTARPQVVILCGGKGTRLREHTESIPKPLVEIGGKPIIWHLMKIYASYGFEDFVLCLGYKGEQIRQFVKQGNRWNVLAVDTGQETNTAGRLKRVQPYVTSPTFFATYADGLASIDLSDLLAFHRKQATVGTMTCVKPWTHYGLVEIGAGHRVTGYLEKPRLDTWVNGGFFVFEQALFESIHDHETLEREPLERLMHAGQLSAYPFDGFWVCMDTYKDTQTLNQLWKSGHAEWKVWTDGERTAEAASAVVRGAGS